MSSLTGASLTRHTKSIAQLKPLKPFFCHYVIQSLSNAAHHPSMSGRSTRIIANLFLCHIISRRVWNESLWSEAGIDLVAVCVKANIRIYLGMMQDWVGKGVRPTTLSVAMIEAFFSRAPGGKVFIWYAASCLILLPRQCEAKRWECGFEVMFQMRLMFNYDVWVYVSNSKNCVSVISHHFLNHSPKSIVIDHQMQLFCSYLGWCSSYDIRNIEKTLISIWMM